jgi:hypothetical protein
VCGGGVCVCKKVTFFMAGGHGTRTTNPNNIDIPDILFRRERGTAKRKKEIQNSYSSSILYLLVRLHSSSNLSKDVDETVNFTIEFVQCRKKTKKQ